MDKTKEILKSMFLENTGIALCDSGGIPEYDEDGNYVKSSSGYGRNFERNRGLDLDSLPDIKLKYNINYIDVTISTYKWLYNICTYHEELDDLFHNTFAKDRDDKSWLTLMLDFPTWLVENHADSFDNLKSVCGQEFDSDKGIFVNSYNEPSLLDQVIQFAYFSVNYTEYVILQVHGGADVRGGYTQPRIFEVGNSGELDIFRYGEARIFCTNESCREGFYTDDAYTFYSDNGNSDLNDYNVKILEEEHDKWEEGLLCIKDTQLLCPTCGYELKASL